MGVTNGSFETREPGWNPGNPDDWTIEAFNAEYWRWAHYKAHATNAEYWAVERFEGGWDNDDGFLDELTASMVDYFDVDGGTAETFEYWVAGSLMEFKDEFDGFGYDLEEALYEIWGGVSPTTATAEMFESEWSADEPIAGKTLFHIESWVDGDPPTDYDVGLGSFYWTIGANNALQMYLAKWTGAAISAATIQIEIAAGIWTPSALRTELQTQTNADLVAASFSANDILWSVNPQGGLRVANAKSGYYLWLVMPDSGSAWSTLGFDILEYPDPSKTESMPRPLESAKLELAQYSGSLDQEWFGLGWDNDVADYLWWGTDWYDFHADDPTSFTITASVNDLIDIWLDNFVGLSVQLQITIAAGTYTLAQMVTELETKINAALTAAGAPWGPANIDVVQSPKGQLRFELNTSGITGGPNMIFAPPSAAPARDAYPTLGIDEEAWVVGSFSFYRRSRRPAIGGGVYMWKPAMYDSGLNPQEDFEGTWTPMP